jgi:anti-sigma B factor antagonist
MRIDERKVGDVMVISVSGDITMAKGGDVVLKDKVRSLIEQGQRKLVVDLGDVSYVDSAGLGQLVQAHATAAGAGGALKLVRVTKRLKDLLTITKLVTVFDSYNDEESALASFGASS